MLAVFELWWIFFFGSLSNKYSTLRSQSRPCRFPFNNCGPIFDGNETDWKTTVNKSKQTHRPSWTLRISFGGRKFQSCEKGSKCNINKFSPFSFRKCVISFSSLCLYEVAGRGGRGRRRHILSIWGFSRQRRVCVPAFEVGSNVKKEKGINCCENEGNKLINLMENEKTCSDCWNGKLQQIFPNLHKTSHID